MGTKISDIWKVGTSAPVPTDLTEAGSMAVDITGQKLYFLDNLGALFVIGTADGTVMSVNDVDPDTSGNVDLTPADIDAPSNTTYNADQGAQDTAMALVQTNLDDHEAVVAGNPHAVTQSDVGLANVNNTSDAAKPISTATQTDLNLRYYKADHIADNSGGEAAGKPIVLNSFGQLDPSFIETNAFRPVAPWTPVPGNEYPDNTAALPGDFWWVENVSDPYTFIDVGGDLEGRQIRNGDFMVWGVNGWGIMIGEMNPLLYYKLDGSIPISSTFNAGDHRLSSLADGVALTDAVTVGQWQTKYGIQDAAIDLNTDKVSYTDAEIVAQNTTDAATAQGTADGAVSHNTSQDVAINLNTAKVGITPQQTSDITANTAKVGVTDEVHSTIGEAGAVGILNMVSITQAEYDLLTPVATTLYVIVG